MRNFALFTIGLALLLALFAAGGYAPSSEKPAPSVKLAVNADDPPTPTDPLAVCFAPGTPESYMRDWEQRIWGSHALDFNIATRWTNTATDGATGPLGTGCHLTYSFIPDGTIIDGQPSQLFQTLNQQFGSPEIWQNMFARVFAEWAAVSGLRYVHEINDDGAPFASSPGVLGVRGDVRIGSVPIDGPSGVLAYDYYPDTGDMVLDASETWGSRGRDYIFFRNITAHEHGHGWGLAHVCPVDNTKLLEPFYSSAFDGPQNDDIRAVQQNYGDTYQPNYSAATAYPLGLIDHDATVANASLRSSDDQDYFKFRIPAGKGFTLSLVPVGSSYLNGPQHSDGSCDPGTMINSLNMQDLDLFLLNSSGQTQLAQSNTHPAGEIERIFRYIPSAQGDSFMVKITGGVPTGQQVYDVQFEVFNLADPYLSFTPLVFDTTNLGTPVTLTPQLINPWTSPLQVTSITTTAPFTVTPQGPLTIPPNGNVNLTVTFPGSPLGLQTGVLTIAHSGPGGTLSTDLTATAITSGLIFVGSNVANFGDVALNTTDSARLILRVTGNTPLTILSMTTSAPFSVAFDGPITLNPTQSFIPWVHFHPTTLGAATADLIIIHTAASSPDTAVLSGVGVTPQSAGDNPVLPAEYRLMQNYPNPFNPSTEIRFSLTEAGLVQLRVYNRMGQLVTTLMDEARPAGSYTLTWNGKSSDGSSVASGLYFYQIRAGKFTETKKMLLMR